MRVLVLALLFACSTNEVGSPPPEPAGAPPVEQQVPVDVATEPEPEPVGERLPMPPPSSAPIAGALADGSDCLLALECASGICEGQGCGTTTAGTCAPKQRACTRDRRAFCGCDGVTFFSSGSCPGRRYARAGTCD